MCLCVPCPKSLNILKTETSFNYPLITHLISCHTHIHHRVDCTHIYLSIKSLWSRCRSDQAGRSRVNHQPASISHPSVDGWMGPLRGGWWSVGWRTVGSWSQNHTTQWDEMKRNFCDCSHCLAAFPSAALGKHPPSSRERIDSVRSNPHEDNYKITARNQWAGRHRCPFCMV